MRWVLSLVGDDFIIFEKARCIPERGWREN